MNIHRLFAVLLTSGCLLHGTASYAESGQYRFYTPKSVIEQGCSSIKDMARDSIGFLWMATPDGLYRYDGYQTRLYKSPDVNVSYQGFKSVFIDGGGNLWARNFANTYSYDFYNDRLTLQGDSLLLSLGTEITASSLIVDQEGKLWGESSDGTLVFHTFGDRPADYLFRTEEGPFISAASRDGNSFVLSRSGAILQLYPWKEKAVQPFARYPMPSNTDDIRMFIDSSSRLWIYDAGGNATFLCLNISDGTPENTSRLKRILGRDHINDIIEDESGNLWIATDRTGIIHLNKSGKSLVLERNLSDSFSLPSNNIDCLFLNGNSLWAGTHSYGPVFTTLTSPLEGIFYTAENSAINLITQDTDGNIWMGHDSEGIRIYAGNGRNYLLGGVPNPTVLSSAKDPEGLLWFASYGGGVFFYDNGRFKVPEALTFLPEISLCQAIRFDSKGTLWIASCDHGLFSMTPDGKLSSYPGKMSTDYLTALEYNPLNNTIYIGTDVGLYTADASSGEICLLDLYDPAKSNELAHPSVICIDTDANGRTWVGGYTGLYVLDCNNKVLRHISSADGLLSDGVKSVIDDGYGREWVAGDGGVSCIIPDENGFPSDIRAFSGIGSNMVFNPVRNSICRTDDGKILIGSEACYIRINPTRLVQNTEKRRVLFTDLFVNGSYAGSLQASSSVELNHKDATYFTIGLTALNIHNLTPDRFQYRLSEKGPWKNVQGYTIPFHKLHHGKYSLEVRAAGDDGRYCASSKLSLLISPPWWLSLPAKICYLAAFLILTACLLGNIKKKYQKAMDRQRTELEETSRKRMEIAEKEILTRVAGSTLLQKVNEAVNQHLDDADYSVDRLCKDLGISRSGLYKKVIAITGISPLEYIHLIRVKKGKELLDEGESNVSQAAWKTGLSPKQFALYFRKTYGILPSEYIKEH